MAPTFIPCRFNGHNGQTHTSDGHVTFYGLDFDTITDAVKLLSKVRPDEYRGVRFGRNGFARGLVRPMDGRVLVSAPPYTGKKIFMNLEKAQNIMGPCSSPG